MDWLMVLLEEQLAREAEALAEEELVRNAIADGDFLECQCCFTDTPIVRSTQCTGTPSHSFCLDCAKGAALAQLELQRWKFPCMDSSGCDAEFSSSEKRRFLSNEALVRAERLQQQEELKNAGIEGLEDCPRCDYAEIYPPIEENRIFECKNEACDMISVCRLCRKEAHIPKSCEEYAKDLGISQKNAIAEAMTDALIRKCPKCSTPIVKEEGCNKMTCSKCGCAFCDVCGKDISRETYNHFSGNGPCRQTDNFKTRDETRVKEAEEAAKAKALAENSSLNEDDLTFKFSEAVNGSRDSAGIHRLQVREPYALLGEAGEPMAEYHRVRERVRRRVLARHVAEAEVAVVAGRPNNPHPERVPNVRNDVAAARALLGYDPPRLPLQLPQTREEQRRRGEAQGFQQQPEVQNFGPYLPIQFGLPRLMQLENPVPPPYAAANNAYWTHMTYPAFLGPAAAAQQNVNQQLPGNMYPERGQNGYRADLRMTRTFGHGNLDIPAPDMLPEMFGRATWERMMQQHEDVRTRLATPANGHLPAQDIMDRAPSAAGYNPLNQYGRR